MISARSSAAIRSGSHVRSCRERSPHDAQKSISYAPWLAGAVTPNLDGLAARGMIYRQHLSDGRVCAPARTTIISGFYPPCTGTEHTRRHNPPSRRHENVSLLSARGPRSRKTQSGSRRSMH
ncbi:MAG: sulfatase-like hydrolase/transferase [Acidobacteria bacterium]|nr:sulfatase-like hydrolase/transferase [Acidobacteriota bacterium]